MNGLQEKARLVWQVEMVDDELQPAIDAYVMLRRTADAVSRYVEDELSQWGITTSQYGIMLHLMSGKVLSMSDLSERIFRSNSSLTSIIDRMEEDGMVTRAAHQNDRRVTNVLLTAKGKDLLQKIRAKHRAFLADMMSCLEPEELTQLYGLLQKIEARLGDEGCPEQHS